MMQTFRTHSKLKGLKVVVNYSDIRLISSVEIIIEKGPLTLTTDEEIEALAEFF